MWEGVIELCSFRWSMSENDMLDEVAGGVNSEENSILVPSEESSSGSRTTRNKRDAGEGSINGSKRKLHLLRKRTSQIS